MTSRVLVQDNSTTTVRPPQRKTCPSGRCREGATLLGIVGPTGVVGYISPKMTIDVDFVAAAEQGRTPEARFRFAEPCVEQQCSQWKETYCGLIDQVLASPAARDVLAAAISLPDCGIRASCRWFGQTGTKACAICPHVVHSPTRESS